MNKKNLKQIDKVKISGTISKKANKKLEILIKETGLTKSNIIELVLKEVDIKEVKKGLIIKKIEVFEVEDKINSTIKIMNYKYKKIIIKVKNKFNEYYKKY